MLVLAVLGNKLYERAPAENAIFDVLNSGENGVSAYRDLQSLASLIRHKQSNLNPMSELYLVKKIQQSLFT